MQIIYQIWRNQATAAAVARGARVVRGEPLAVLQYNDRGLADRALPLLDRAFTVTPAGAVGAAGGVAAAPLVYERITRA